MDPLSYCVLMDTCCCGLYDLKHGCIAMGMADLLLNALHAGLLFGIYRVQNLIGGEAKTDVPASLLGGDAKRTRLVLAVECLLFPANVLMIRAAARVIRFIHRSSFVGMRFLIRRLMKKRLKS